MQPESACSRFEFSTRSEVADADPPHCTPTCTSLPPAGPCNEGIGEYLLLKSTDGEELLLWAGLPSSKATYHVFWVPSKPYNPEAAVQHDDVLKRELLQKMVCQADGSPLVVGTIHGLSLKPGHVGPLAEWRSAATLLTDQCAAVQQVRRGPLSPKPVYAAYQPAACSLP